jgi:hypothetical protein
MQPYQPVDIPLPKSVAEAKEVLYKGLVVELYNKRNATQANEVVMIDSCEELKSCDRRARRNNIYVIVGRALRESGFHRIPRRFGVTTNSKLRIRQPL